MSQSRIGRLAWKNCQFKTNSYKTDTDIIGMNGDICGKWYIYKYCKMWLPCVLEVTLKQVSERIVF